MYNRIVLVGRLTKDPELRYTPSGKAVASFRLAVNRGRNDEADFLDVVVWERQAETVSQYCSKGKLVLVEGRLQKRQYDAQDGTRRTVYEVVASLVRFMPDGQRGGEQGPAPARQSGAPADPGQWAGYNPDEDDVPF